MTPHVFARVAGFRLTIIPRAPFRIEYADDDSVAIDVEHESTTGQLFARLTPDGGGYKSKLDQHRLSLFDVLDVETRPDIGYWRIETSVFTCCWPRGYTICSNNVPDDPGPFDLMGPNGEMIYIQSPQTIPDVADLFGPSQQIVKIERTADFECIDLEYTQKGYAWRQRHLIVTMLDRRVAITMQAPSELAARAVDAATSIARSRKLSSCFNLPNSSGLIR